MLLLSPNLHFQDMPLQHWHRQWVLQSQFQVNLPVSDFFLQLKPPAPFDQPENKSMKDY